MEDPWAADLHPEKVQQAEPGIHSSRVDQSYRLIWKHIKPNDIVLCLVDKHDEAYRRAARKAFTLEDGMVKVADILDVGAERLEGDGSIFDWMRRGTDEVGLLFAGYRDKDTGAILEAIMAHATTRQNEKLQTLVWNEYFYWLLFPAMLTLLYLYRPGAGSMRVGHQGEGS